MTALQAKNLCLTPWCNVQQCEVDVKERSKEESIAMMADGDADELQLTGSAKTLCIPKEQNALPENATCFHCGKPATVWALWGRSY